MDNALQALPDAERSLQLDSNDARALDTRGHILEALGRRDEAIADYRRALAKDSDHQCSKKALKRLGASP
jgi:regulator of sirC expression with transglutaminase-like and TPR domain